MRETWLVFAAVLVLVLVGRAAGEGFELRTWAMSGAAPVNGEPLSGSASFVLRSRLGGPFVGHAESESFALWGCGAYTPVEAALFAWADEDADDPTVTIRWTLEGSPELEGLNILRATDAAGPFERINPEPLPVESPGVYVDRTTWPGSWFWYELWGVTAGGADERISLEPVAARTGGALETRMYAASPNPFRRHTVLKYDIARVAAGIRLAVYDVTGRLVRSLGGQYDTPGRYSTTWDGTDDSGARVASGVYFCVLEAGGTRETRRLVLLR